MKRNNDTICVRTMGPDGAAFLKLKTCPYHFRHLGVIGVPPLALMDQLTSKQTNQIMIML